MKIGPRIHKSHRHIDKTCVMQHKRVINGTTFLFSYVGNAEKRTYKVTVLDRWGRPVTRAHILTVKESPFGVVDENDDIVYMGAKLEAGVDF